MAVKRYRKIPVVIDAIQWDGSNEVAQEICEWVLASGGEAARVTNPFTDSIAITTLEGTMYATGGWWVIRGVAGEFYPCAPEIFAQTYVSVGLG